jgi:hypothetical protein
VAERYYYGQFWESFRDPVAALVDAGFPSGFARTEMKTAGWNDVSWRSMITGRAARA